ncbi:MAG TPA: PhoH family protein [bacterium]|nr:PhoH family protein [bacterium]
MKKFFVLDTNVLLHDPRSLYAFADNQVVVPLIVIEELDTFKRRQDEVGRNSRVASHELDALRQQSPLSQGADLESGGSVLIMIEHQDISQLPAGLQKPTADNQILAVAAYLQKQNPGVPVTLVSKDLNMRIKADAVGLKAADYETDTVNIDELYSGYAELTLPAAQLDAFGKSRELALSDEQRAGLYHNQFIMLIDAASASHTALGWYKDDKKKVVALHSEDKKIWGIKARNKEQRFALEMLLDDSIKIVTMVGFAGTGKTLLALAAGLHRVVDENKYKKLLVSRPIIPMGKDLGFLPGDVQDKLMPRMQPISDNLEFLFSQVGDPHLGESELNELLENGVVELEPLTYIRGRSIPDQYIIVDEAQNLTPHEIKTIITRAGSNTKIVLTGDPYQIDHAYLDSDSNGLTYLVERFKGQAMSAHITFTKGERSELAEMAARLLR